MQQFNYTRRCAHCGRRYAASRIEVGRFCSLACAEAEKGAQCEMPKAALSR